MPENNIFAPPGDIALEANDNSYSTFFDIRSVFEDEINFFGKHFDGLYINNNGNVTFGSPAQIHPHQRRRHSELAIIAPFWGDVDTRANGSLVTYGLNPARNSLVVTWANVDYYKATSSDHHSKFNSFQLELFDRGHGDFDIVFRYGTLAWTTGDASSGQDGLGGHVARAGFSSGDGQNYFELPESGSQADMLRTDLYEGQQEHAGPGNSKCEQALSWALDRKPAKRCAVTTMTISSTDVEVTTSLMGPAATIGFSGAAATTPFSAVSGMTIAMAAMASTH